MTQTRLAPPTRAAAAARGLKRFVEDAWDRPVEGWRAEADLREDFWGLPETLTSVSDENGRFELRFVESMDVQFWPDRDRYECRVEYLHPDLTGRGVTERE